MEIPRGWDDLLAAYFLSENGVAEFERAGYAHRQELQRLADLHRAGHLALPDLEQRTRILQDKLNTLRPTADPAAREVVNMARPFGDFWKRLTPLEKRTLLQVIFAALYFNRAVAYDPFRKLLGLPEDGMVNQKEQG